MVILRAIAAVILGYLAMFATVFVTFTVAFLIMGAGASFQEGSYEVSTLWLIVSFVLGFIAAILGGLVCALVAMKGSKAPVVLAGLVLLLGLAMAIPVITASSDEAPAVRTGEVGNFEAMQNARQPVIAAVLNPLIGAIGVVLGARLVRREGGAPAGPTT